MLVRHLLSKQNINLIKKNGKNWQTKMNAQMNDPEIY